MVKKERASATIEGYTSAIKKILKMEGITIDATEHNLAGLIKAAKYKNNVLTVRLPIQRNLLGLIIDWIEERFYGRSQPFLSKLHSAIAITAYYGMLRIGNLTQSPPPPHNSNRRGIRIKQKEKISTSA